MLLLPVQGVEQPKMLCLHVILLQQHHHPLPALQLLLPRPRFLRKMCKVRAKAPPSFIFSKLLSHIKLTLLRTCHRPDQLPSVLQMPKSNEAPEPVVMCTQHMCPIHVHWHVKLSYKKYWRVKLTVTNLNYVKNYSEWNLVVQHPNLQSVEQIFSFNYRPLDQYGKISKSTSYS